MSDKNTLIIECYIQKENLNLLRSLSEILFVAPALEISKAEYLIDDDKFSEAEKVLDNIEKEYGESPVTVKLRTRISRIKLLGVYENKYYKTW